MECRSRSAAVRPARPAPAPAVRARATRCADASAGRARSPGSWMVPGRTPAIARFPASGLASLQDAASRCRQPFASCPAAGEYAQGLGSGGQPMASRATRAPRRICSAVPTPEHGAGDGFRWGRSVWNTASGTPAPAPGAHRAAPPWRRGTGSPGCRDLPRTASSASGRNPQVRFGSANASRSIVDPSESYGEAIKGSFICAAVGGMVKSRRRADETRLSNRIGSTG